MRLRVSLVATSPTCTTCTKLVVWGCSGLLIRPVQFIINLSSKFCCWILVQSCLISDKGWYSLSLAGLQPKLANGNWSFRDQQRLRSGEASFQSPQRSAAWIRQNNDGDQKMVQTYKDTNCRHIGNCSCSIFLMQVYVICNHVWVSAFKPAAASGRLTQS